MTRFTAFVICVLFSLTIDIGAQVFNTAHVLRNGTFSLGLNPTLLNIVAEDDAGVFVHGGYGIGSGLDLAVQLGLGFEEPYIGFNIEKQLNVMVPTLSISGGLHSFNDVGLDFTFQSSYRVSPQVDIYAGLDFDLVFAEKKEFNPVTDRFKTENDTRFLSWFFLGSEVAIRQNTTLLFEAEIGISDDAYDIFGGGINFYF